MVHAVVRRLDPAVGHVVREPTEWALLPPSGSEWRSPRHPRTPCVGQCPTRVVKGDRRPGSSWLETGAARTLIRSGVYNLAAADACRGGSMSGFHQGNGWWLACDGEWYPPQSLADWRRDHLADSHPLEGEESGPRPVPSVTEPDMPPPFMSGAPGWWEASDGAWDPAKFPAVAQPDSVGSTVDQAG